MALHRDPSVWGPNPDAFDPENFSREAEAKRPVNAWKPFGNGQRACIGRGFAMHEAALAIGMILQRFKLIDNHRYQMHAEGNADDQARRLQDQGAAARRQGSRRLRRPCSRGRRRLERGGAAGADPSRPQHAAAGALRLQPRHRRRTGDAGGRSRRGQRLCDQARRRSTTTSASCRSEGARADLLRLLQWRRRPTTPRSSSNGCDSDLPKDALRQGALRRVRLRQQRLGRDLSVGAAHDRRATGRAWRAQRLCAAARAMPAAISTASSRNGSRRAAPAATKEFGVAFELHAAAPTTRRCTRSSRWRRRPSTPSSRSAALRR